MPLSCVRFLTCSGTFLSTVKRLENEEKRTFFMERLETLAEAPYFRCPHQTVDDLGSQLEPISRLKEQESGAQDRGMPHLRTRGCVFSRISRYKFPFAGEKLDAVSSFKPFATYGLNWNSPFPSVPGLSDALNQVLETDLRPSIPNSSLASILPPLVPLLQVVFLAASLT